VDRHEAATTRLLRPLVLDLAGSFGNEAVIEDALGLFGAYYYQQEPLAADVRAVVYKLSARSGVSETHSALLAMYKRSGDANQRRQLLRALAHVQSQPLINSTLALALTPEVLSQDIGPLLAAVGSQGGMHFQLTWAFVAEHGEQLLARFPGGGAEYSLGRRLGQLAPLFLQPADYHIVAELDGRFPGLLPPQFLHAVRESVAANLKWINGGGQQACRWLGEQMQ
jgi:hypothetical protein